MNKTKTGESPARQESPNLAKMAIEKGLQINELRAILDLQKEWESRVSLREFNEAIAKFQALVKPVSRSSAVKYQGKGGTVNFKFAGLSEILPAITPVLSECGLSVRWKNEDVNNQLKITCIVSHVGGHSESCSMMGEPDVSGGKNNIQAKGSTMTYLQRYTLNLLLAISTEEDNDGAGGAPVSKPKPNESQWNTIKDRVKGGLSIEKILEHFTLHEGEINFLQDLTKRDDNAEQN